ncbi:hypothetical protein BH09DEP1_BH09DEP1_5920 [soil metagenome]
MNFLKSLEIGALFLFLMAKPSFVMEQEILALKENIHGDCSHLKYINWSEAKVNLTDESVDEIFPRRCLRLTSDIRIEDINWTLTTKGYLGDQPFCSLVLNCDRKLESHERERVKKMLDEVVAENNKKSRAEQPIASSPVPLRLYLTQATLKDQNTQTFFLFGLFK